MVKKEMEASALERSRSEYENSVIEEAVKVSEIEFPPVLTEAEIERLVDEQTRRFRYDER